jgi:tRNA A37 threonylcarbamoyladenosine synthetase subunit TsaC/SUA5/YrdC
METVQLLDNEGVASVKAVDVLQAGGVILYPTDTLYGLGADAFSDKAVDKVYAIKNWGKPSFDGHIEGSTLGSLLVRMII